MCGGITQTSIETLRVNGRKILDVPKMFNHYCVEEKALHSIEIRREGNAVRVEMCHAAWEWGVGYHHIRCEAREL